MSCSCGCGTCGGSKKQSIKNMRRGTGSMIRIPMKNGTLSVPKALRSTALCSCSNSFIRGINRTKEGDLDRFTVDAYLTCDGYFCVGHDKNLIYSWSVKGPAKILGSAGKKSVLVDADGDFDLTVYVTFRCELYAVFVDCPRQLTKHYSVTRRRRKQTRGRP